MRNIIGILSLRKIKQEVFRQVVYEWEDEISNLNNIPIIEITEEPVFFKNKKNLYEKIVGKLEYLRPLPAYDENTNVYLSFMTMPDDIIYVQDKKVLPVFLDLWNRQMPFVLNKIKNKIPCFVTSYDMYEKMKAQGDRYNVEYLPLMMSSIWNDNIYVENKDVDIFQFGRKNTLLHSWALAYIETHPNVKYVYSDSKGTMGQQEYSALDGSKYNLCSREAYINFLKRSKICLVSSPGVDGEKIEAEDIDFPTPRFYEAPACFCYLVGRYSQHVEFKMQGIDDICYNVNSYDEFEITVSKILSDYSVPKNILYQQYNEEHSVKNWYKKLVDTFGRM